MSLTMAESLQRTLPAFPQQVPRISAFSTWQTEVGWKGQVHASPPPPPPAHAPAPRTCLSCLLHTWRCCAMHLSLAHMAMLRNAPVFLVSCIHGGCYAMQMSFAPSDTWWMLHAVHASCFSLAHMVEATQCTCLSQLAHMVDATQRTYLSCLWHTWWMLRNARVFLVSCTHGGCYATRVSFLSLAHMADAMARRPLSLLEEWWMLCIVTLHSDAFCWWNSSGSAFPYFLQLPHSHRNGSSIFCQFSSQMTPIVEALTLLIVLSRCLRGACSKRMDSHFLGNNQRVTRSLLRRHFSGSRFGSLSTYFMKCS